MSEENKAVVRRLYNEVFNRTEMGVIDEIYAPDAELHLPGFPEDPFGPAPVHQLAAMICTAFPGIQSTIEDLIDQGDKVVARATFHRAHESKLLGIGPQSRLTTWTRIDIFRLFQGRIVEHWADRDDAGLLQQLGVVPPPLITRGQVPARDYSH